MFSWATNQLETLAQTVAPPPADPASRFLHACQLGKEQDASTALEEMTNPLHEVVVPAKNQGALLVACLHGLPAIVDKLITIAIQQQQTFDIMQVLDVDGNNPLHCACMSNQASALAVVKYLLEKTSKSAVGTKNNLGQTPYDVAALDSVRQFLLPIQLQAETQAALANGGAGLPPGIDMCGLKVSHSNLAPPPIAQPPRSSPESGNRPPSAPSSGSQYAYRGGSSAAMKTVKGITPDGFHSSSSDKTLQEKYGHQAVGYGSAIPPPPSSGNSHVSLGSSPMSALPPPPNSGGPNPYSAGLALGSANRRSLRYVAFDPINGASPVPAASPMPLPAAGAAQQRVAPAQSPTTFMPPPPAMSIPMRGSSVSSNGSFAPSPAKSLRSQGSFSNPPTPTAFSNPATPASATFSNPPTPSAAFANPAPTSGNSFTSPLTPNAAFSNPPTPSAAFANPAPTSGNSFTSPPTPNAAFSNPPPTPSAAFSNPPTPSATFSNPPTSGNSFTNPPTPSNAFSNPPTPSATFSSPPTPPSSQGAPFQKPPAAAAASVFGRPQEEADKPAAAASAVFGTPPQQQAETTTTTQQPVAASSLFARPPTMTSLQKPVTSSAVDTFPKPVAAETMFAQPPPGGSSSPTKATTIATEVTMPEPVAAPAVPPEESVDGGDDDEGEMDEVPLTPGQSEGDAATSTAATGIALPPPLTQN